MESIFARVQVYDKPVSSTRHYSPSRILCIVYLFYLNGPDHTCADRGDNGVGRFRRYKTGYTFTGLTVKPHCDLTVNGVQHKLVKSVTRGPFSVKASLSMKILYCLPVRINRNCSIAFGTCNFHRWYKYCG
jgi:hypothetical protein